MKRKHAIELTAPGVDVDAESCRGHAEGHPLTDRKVVPFRKRPPSEAELEMYRRITRNWHPAMRQFVLPEHFKRDQASDKDR